MLASGRGSNFQAIARAVESGFIPATLAALVTDRADAGALAIARAHGIQALCIDPHDHWGPEAHEAQVIAALDERGVELVCLAGYMRLLSGAFVKHFEGRLLNIHPSLLPAFPGLRAIDEALAAQVETTGVTVHLVDAGMDSGPVLRQERVPVEPRESLVERIHAVEHRLLPEVVRELCAR